MSKQYLFICANILCILRVEMQTLSLGRVMPHFAVNQTLEGRAVMAPCNLSLATGGQVRLITACAGDPRAQYGTVAWQQPTASKELMESTLIATNHRLFFRLMHVEIL